ncbi:MAG: orotate phosphoribosyltransferase [Bacteroidales bacterium]|nr:orotate phosphoribosyltransferase [Bacteroidales bacterium]
MKNINKSLAGRLLQCEAIKLSLDPPFQWSSGWKSPIYCDNRITLSYPEIRNLIKYSFVALIKEKFLSTEAVAAVATGAIAHGALVADELGIPFLYVRSEPKTHGLANLIEGSVTKGQKVVVIEDLVSTGRSSIRAVEALRANGAIVSGMVAIFTYGFKKAVENFKNAGCELYTLSNFESLLEIAVETGYIEGSNLEILKKWMQDPENWTNS